jgi:hypothetical protein
MAQNEKPMFIGSYYGHPSYYSSESDSTGCDDGKSLVMVSDEEEEMAESDRESVDGEIASDEGELSVDYEQDNYVEEVGLDEGEEVEEDKISDDRQEIGDLEDGELEAPYAYDDTYDNNTEGIYQDELGDANTETDDYGAYLSDDQGDLYYEAGDDGYDNEWETGSAGYYDEYD